MDDAVPIEPVIVGNLMGDLMNDDLVWYGPIALADGDADTTGHPLPAMVSVRQDGHLLTQ